MIAGLVIVFLAALGAVVFLVFKKKQSTPLGYVSFDDLEKQHRKQQQQE